jgi:hypothetical protein
MARSTRRSLTGSAASAAKKVLQRRSAPVTEEAPAAEAPAKKAPAKKAPAKKATKRR